MADNYFTIETDKVKDTDITLQLERIKEFPVFITFYDRTFRIDNKEELHCLVSGFEIGYQLGEINQNVKQ